VAKDLYANNKMELINKFFEMDNLYAKCFIAVCAILIILSLHTKFTRSRAKRQIEEKCKTAKTIFVILLAHYDNATKSLFDLFENADCPTNINVSVYDTNGSNCKENYTKMASRFGKIGESFSKNIAVLKRFPHDQGDYAAIYNLLKHNYQNEEYLCIMNDNIFMNKGWDTTLINLIQKNDIITGLPDHFSILDSFEDGIPKIALKKSSKLGKTFKQQFWTKHFSFSKSWKHLQSFNNKFLLGGTDILISSELTKMGYQFKNVANVFHFAHYESSWKRNANSMQASRECIEFLKLNMPIQKLGIYPHLKPSSILGIVNENDKEEIEIKYGHIADYVYMKDLRFSV